MEEIQEVLDLDHDHDDHDRQKSDPTPAPAPAPSVDCRSIVDTSRPFRSVKEAVAIFGERFLLVETYTPKPFTFPKKETPYFSPSPSAEKESHWNYMSPHSDPSRGSSDNNHDTTTISDAMKKLEAEMEDTKAELKLLKERESETEVALASLNAELHKNMSKLAWAEAAAAASSRSAVVRKDTSDGAMMVGEGEKKMDENLRMESVTSPSLVQILSIGEKEGVFVGRKKEKKVMKKKPIIPLVGDLFSRKKTTATALHNPLYNASSHLQWN